MIFPVGIENRIYVVREMAASAVFVMLYLGAIEGTGYHVKPDQIVRMNDRQAAKTSESERLEWRLHSVRPGGQGGWYAKNTREPIRDETLRQGLVRHGAATELQDVPTTSPRGRYSLNKGFAALFDPRLVRIELEKSIQAWRETTLSAGARARLRILRSAAVETAEGVLVAFPNGETRRLTTGPSSTITKAVAEVFAPEVPEDTRSPLGERER